MAGEKVLVVDASNWMYVYHQAGDADLAYGCAARIRSFAARFSFDRVVVAFDCERSFRHDLLDGYKAGRSEKPPIIIQAMPRFFDICCDEGWGWEVDSYEADDLIATTVRSAVLRGNKVTICSADKDLRQLLRDGKVNIARSIGFSLGEVAKVDWYTTETFVKKYEFIPDLFTTYQALMGDPCDKVPGCSGIGEKAATYLVKQFGSIKKIQRMALTPDAFRLNRDQKKNLCDWFRSGDWQRSYRLVTLVTDIPNDPFTWE